MLKLVPDRRVWFPVTWPGFDEAGKSVTNRIEMLFILHDEEKMVEIGKLAFEVQRAGEAAIATALGLKTPPAEAGEDLPPLPEDKTKTDLMAAFVREIAADWRHVGAANGDPLKFEDEDALRLFVRIPGHFKAVGEAYGRLRAGGADARRGN